ncbi:DNA-binding protein [Priestia megaterium]|nr:DNA-binding protein [Priestia megaterium]
MRKKELVQSISEKTGETQKKVQEILEMAMDEIMETVSTGQKVTLMGFGTFEPRKRKKKRGTNPSTRKPMTIPAKRVPAFRPSQQFKGLLD